MGKPYKGKNLLKRVSPLQEPGGSQAIQMHPGDIHLFMDLMSGYSHLAFPAVIDPKHGMVLLHTTPECFDDLQKVIRSLPMPITLS